MRSPIVDWRFATARLYLGTDRGVYWSTSGGSNWSTFAKALPRTMVTDLQLDTKNNVLAAGTYGRGVFEIQVGHP